MSKQIAKNTFTGGLLMDMNPLSSQNTVLTNALNATLVTIDGDEMILLNDMGNLKATYTENGEEFEVTLTPGFIPIGILTLNGVAYIVSFNPTTQEGEIGTFPSPQYNINSEGILANDYNYIEEDGVKIDRSKLINKYQPLYNLYKGSDPNEPSDDPVRPSPTPTPVPPSPQPGENYKLDKNGKYAYDPITKLYVECDDNGIYYTPDVNGNYYYDSNTKEYLNKYVLDDNGKYYLQASTGRYIYCPNRYYFEKNSKGTYYFEPESGNYIYYTFNDRDFKKCYFLKYGQGQNEVYSTVDTVETDLSLPCKFYKTDVKTSDLTENDYKNYYYLDRGDYKSCLYPVEYDTYYGRVLFTPDNGLIYAKKPFDELHFKYKKIGSDDNAYKPVKADTRYSKVENTYSASASQSNSYVLENEIIAKQDSEIKNLLFPMRTTHFTFDLEHPVDIELQVSYDDSVNIILNDGKNIPRLINSRFAALKDGTWEIPKRHKNTDNVYKVNANYKKNNGTLYYTEYFEPACRCDETCDSDLCNPEICHIEDEILSECGCTPVSCKLEVANLSIFDITTSLNKRVEIFPVVKYNGVLNTGNLPVGNYVLYFKYSDEDGNETDFVAESGIISIFKGNDGDPFSIDGGERDMDSNKSIRVSLLLIDSAYSYVKVYYTRTSAAADENRVVQAFEINNAFEVSDTPDSEGYNVCHITITGDEAKTQIDVNEINQPYTIVNSAESLALINNIFFMSNIKTQKLYYKELTNLSLRVIPYFNVREESERIGHVKTLNYSNFRSDRSKEINDPLYFDKEYYNTKNIYYNVGYWNEEYYRLGIVYIYEDGSLSPVFNTLGYEMVLPINENRKPIEVSYKDDSNFDYLNIDNDGFIDIIEDEHNSNILKGIAGNVNARGVVRINYDENTFEYPGRLPLDLIKLYNLGIYIPNELVSELKHKYCIKGFFTVRQKRIPTILAQGFTLPWDKESKVPLVEYWGHGKVYYKGGVDLGVNVLMPTPFKTYENAYSIGFKEDGFKDYKNYLAHYGETYNFKSLDYKEKEFMFHKMYFVESFLRQCGEEVVGDDSWFPKDPITEGPFNRILTQEYLYRLLNILPCCVDAKMVANYAINGKRPKYPSVYYKTIIDEEKMRKYLEENRGVEGDEATTIINNYKEKEYSNVVDLDGVLRTGCVSLVWRYRVNNNGEITPSHDVIFDEDIQNYNNYDDIKIVEYYTETNRGLVANTYSELLSKIDIETVRNPVEIVQTVGTTRSKLPEEICNCNDSTNTETLCKCITLHVIYSLNNVDDYQEVDSVTNILSGYVYTSYTLDEDVAGNKPNPEENYYYTNSIASHCTGYIELPDEICTGAEIEAYYVNWKLAELKGPWNVYGMTHDKAKIKHYALLYKYVNELQLTAICPEFEVRQPFFNQLFTGTDYYVKYTNYQQGLLVRDSNKERYYFSVNPGFDSEGRNDFYQEDVSKEYNGCDENGSPKASYRHHKFIYSNITYKIAGVTDSVPVVAIDNTIFKAVCGDAAEAYRFEYINEEHCPIRDHPASDGDHDVNVKNIYDFNLVRGLYSPFLGIVSGGVAKYVDDTGKSINCSTEKHRGYSKTFTIYDNSYKSESKLNFLIRMLDTAPYYTISERVSLDYMKPGIPSEDFLYSNEYYTYDLFRGDCFICTFTHRLNRNFQDPTAPSNDKIINHKTWKDHYQPDDDIPESGVSELAKINRGDVNAVKLGSWITVKVRASYNLSIRSLDERNLSEKAMMGRARGFYPVQQASAEGGYKIPNSYLINDGFGSTVGEKIYQTLPEAPYVKEEFSNRIVYSDVNIENSFKNGYRVYRATNTETYTKQYGKIVKLVPWYGHLICVFEHAVGILPINERVESGEGIGGPVFINTKKVLPDTPSIISDKFGSLWKDSIIKTPYAIYGVDTSTKKIWKITGSTSLPSLNIISDFKVENFLKENLPTKDNNTSVVVGLRNVKTHYNLTKADVIFTFYIDTEHDRLTYTGDRSKYDETAWSLCLNEITSDLSSGNSANFTTFYSWIPLESFNLNNKFYSFDRDLVRGMLSFPKLLSLDALGRKAIDFIGKPLYDRSGNLIPYDEINYCCDGNCKDCEDGCDNCYYTKYYEPPMNSCMNDGINIWEHNNPFIRPLPTHWYGKQHPFEFEFVVIEDPSVLKIYEDMKIISNNAKPESFHFAISGDNYEFTEDLPNIYYRQEATKELYGNLGSKVSYNPDYLKVHPNQQLKSTIYPLYYNRLDIYDNIYDLYQLMTNPYRDYQNLSGSEVYRNPRSGKFELVTHIKNTPIDGEWLRLTPQTIPTLLDKSWIPTKYADWDQCISDLLQQDEKSTESDVPLCDFETFLDNIYTICKEKYPLPSCYPKIKKIKNPRWAFNCSCERYWYYIWVPQSRLRGNSHYKEDKWNILIPTITLMLKNEKPWETVISEFDGTEISVPPLVLNWIPKLDNYLITGENLPNTYNIGQVSTDKWTFRKEAKIRDKYCKIKIRYSGEELAIISAVLTIYNVSLS